MDQDIVFSMTIVIMLTKHAECQCEVTIMSNPYRHTCNYEIALQVVLVGANNFFGAQRKYQLLCIDWGISGTCIQLALCEMYKDDGGYQIILEKMFIGKLSNFGSSDTKKTP